MLHPATEAKQLQFWSFGQAWRSWRHSVEWNIWVSNLAGFQARKAPKGGTVVQAPLIVAPFTKKKPGELVYVATNFRWGAFGITSTLRLMSTNHFRRQKCCLQNKKQISKPVAVFRPSPQKAAPAHSAQAQGDGAAAVVGAMPLPSTRPVSFLELTPVLGNQKETNHFESGPLNIKKKKKNKTWGWAPKEGPVVQLVTRRFFGPKRPSGRPQASPSFMYGFCVSRHELLFSDILNPKSGKLPIHQPNLSQVVAEYKQKLAVPLGCERWGNPTMSILFWGSCLVHIPCNG